MLKLLCTAFLFLCSAEIFAQDFKTICNTDTIPFSNGNLNHFNAVLYAPYEEMDTTRIPSFILDSARIYLLKRVGNSFYNKLTYYKSQYIDTSLNEAKRCNAKNYDSRMKYAIQYYFMVQDNMRYYLTLIFDEKGTVISKNQLPDSKTNKQFNEILPVCEVNKRVADDHFFKGELKHIRLDYSNEKNTFVWNVQKPSVKGRKSHESVQRYIIVNATTGKVITRQNKTVRIVCSLPEF
jgi:hypothetical protein